MVIDSYIKEILKARGSIIVPDLGVFRTKYKPARVNVSRKSFSPPSMEVFFDDKMTEDHNDLLFNYICKKTEAEKLEVKENITHFVNEVKESLDENIQVPIANLGYLYKDKAYKTHFVDKSNENILLDSFGLSEFYLEKEIPSEKPVIKPPEEKTDFELAVPRKKTDHKKIIIPFLVLLVVVSTIIYFMVNKEKYHLTNNNKKIVLSTDKTTEPEPVVSENTRTVQKRSTIESNIDSLTKMENALSIQKIDQKYEVYNRFYLIVGSFSTVENAKRLENEMQAKGFNTEILNGKNQIYRVSIKSYTDRQKALKDLESYRAQMTDRSIWLLSVI